jgi:membrane protein
MVSRPAEERVQDAIGVADLSFQQPNEVHFRAEGMQDQRRSGHSGRNTNEIDRARAREVGRGRHAVGPEGIPAAGWKDILYRVFWAIPSDRILSVSGGVAFFTLLAAFPGIATIVSLYGLVADTSTIADHLTLLTNILPAGVLDLVSEHITLIADEAGERLGLAFVVGLILALWTANAGIVALFDALNVVYDEKEKRSPLRLYATTLLFTLGGVAFVVAALLGVIILPIALKFVGSGASAEILLKFIRWPILLIVLIGYLAAVYRYGPSRRDARWRWVAAGSCAAAVLWIAASMLFSWYVVSFDSYNRIYGSLGAGVGFMMWIWLSAVIVLLGAELNAEMEHQTARDTTVGIERPLGGRGAQMADHIGRAQPE